MKTALLILLVPSFAFGANFVAETKLDDAAAKTVYVDNEAECERVEGVDCLDISGVNLRHAVLKEVNGEKVLVVDEAKKALAEAEDKAKEQAEEAKAKAKKDALERLNAIDWDKVKRIEDLIPIIKDIVEEVKH